MVRRPDRLALAITPLVMAVLFGCGARTGVHPAEQADAAAPHDATSAISDTGVDDAGDAHDASAPPDAGALVIPRRTLDARGPSACASDSEGHLRCWGENVFGTVGDGTTETRLVPTLVASIADPIAISTGGASCALDAAGLSCWGDDRLAELDDAMPTTLCSGWRCAVSPLRVASVARAVEISAGLEHTCARVESGRVYCWGSNESGRLGDGTPTDRAVPVPVALLEDAVAIDAGNHHSCAVREGGSIVCWGRNSSGTLGDRTRAPLRTIPVEVIGIDDAIAVGCGNLHTCALSARGTVSCWGNNHLGELGDGTNVDSLAPVSVVGIDDAVQLAVTSVHSCALRRSGAVACWGHNGGALGDGTDVDSSVPVAVVGLDDAIEISAGARSCARRIGGEVVCWGRGPLGDGTTLSSFVPVPVIGLP
jgi:alpha-tubulin suppressor-like RCC1 family protein